jgi:intracellular multiplication protein IcmE
VSDLPLNSDAPTPVVATIVQGPLKGAKAIGAFTANGESMAISFSRIVGGDGAVIQVEGYGVDPYARDPSLRPEVDGHFLSRWGALLASSFLEGFGGAFRRGGRTLYVGGDAVLAEDLRRSGGEAALEALGAVGARAADATAKGFDRPPTLRIRAGTAMGILIASIGQGAPVAGGQAAPRER